MRPRWDRHTRQTRIKLAVSTDYSHDYAVGVWPFGAAGAFCVPYGWELQSRHVDQIAGSESKAQFIKCVSLSARAGRHQCSNSHWQRGFTLVTNRHVRVDAYALHRGKMSRDFLPFSFPPWMSPEASST